MTYAVVIKRSAERELRALPADVERRTGQRLRALSDDQHPTQSKRLRNSDNYRLRVGDYRVIYSVDDVMRQVTVIAIGHRRDVYRRIE